MNDKQKGSLPSNEEVQRIVDGLDDGEVEMYWDLLESTVGDKRRLRLGITTNEKLAVLRSLGKVADASEEEQ